MYFLEELLFDFSLLVGESDLVEKPNFFDNVLSNQMLTICKFVRKKEFCEHIFYSKTGDYNVKIKAGFSCMINNNINFLVCVANTDLVFCVAQHVSHADFVYFPKNRFLYKICHTNNELAFQNIKSLESVLKTNILNADLANNFGFGGIIASHGRPYHFFYDTALMLENLNQANVIIDVPIYQMVDGDFIHFNEIGLNNLQETLDWQELNKRAAANREYYFKVGLNFGFGNQDESLLNLSDGFDRKMLDSARHIKSDIYNQINNKKDQGYFIFWFGITSDKRSWIEQVDAVVEISCKLSNVHKLCIVIDGMTSPLTSSNKDNLIKNDIQVFEEILGRINQIQSYYDICVYSLIGATANDKLKVSTSVDFYIVNAGTGSLWVSRFAKKLGITHISQAFYPHVSKQHISYNALHYPNEWVCDKINNVRIDYISYSISISDMMSFINLNFPVIFDKDYHDWYRFDIGNTANLELIDKHNNIFKSTNNDPQILCSFVKGSLPKDKFCLLIHCYVDYQCEVQQKHAKLYIDYGDGLSETNSIVYKIDDTYNGLVAFKVQTEKSIRNLRFDPLDDEGVLQIKGCFYKILF